MNGKELANFVMEIADDKRALDIVTLDMRGISVMSDFFVICHGNSDRQVQSIARDIRDSVHKSGINVRRMEGFDTARWVLIDLGDVIVHVFHKDDREYYQLEKLWGDAPREAFEGESNLNV
ncbi:ribosome-associated protein [Pullulanibacillus pueri]|uniref:Ribosomal silencing factor RsfS n=1 Tax=Pullulanibacillus pueri TaxID=1437324 RepID=A0A8J3EMJ3_9BACL|nr:ribosome silencing factor [Pullulanibacillus pueri]MBM7683074.1 ribosome-associated protein [Pullulanibacillus pueri]GGH84886.1 ribosomal silencing factor RsfS [Pullulanibacillus pueri]